MRGEGTDTLLVLPCVALLLMPVEGKREEEFGGEVGFYVYIEGQSLGTGSRCPRRHAWKLREDESTSVVK